MIVVGGLRTSALGWGESGDATRRARTKRALSSQYVFVHYARQRTCVFLLKICVHLFNRYSVPVADRISVTIACACFPGKKQLLVRYQPEQFEVMLRMLTANTNSVGVGVRVFPKFYITGGPLFIAHNKCEIGSSQGVAAQTTLIQTE